MAKWPRGKSFSSRCNFQSDSSFFPAYKDKVFAWSLGQSLTCHSYCRRKWIQAPIGKTKGIVLVAQILLGQLRHGQVAGQVKSLGHCRKGWRAAGLEGRRAGEPQGWRAAGLVSASLRQCDGTGFRLGQHPTTASPSRTRTSLLLHSTNAPSSWSKPPAQF